MNNFTLALSLSRQKIKTKEAGKTIVNFNTEKNIELNEKTLKSLLTSHLQSTNI